MSPTQQGERTGTPPANRADYQVILHDKPLAHEVYSLSMDTPTILLVDNGSTRPEATLKLRHLARQLGRKVAATVHPVSLQHADRIPADAIQGCAAVTFASFLRGQLRAGQREFLLLPLFFGASRALSSFVPDQATRLIEEFGDFSLRVADVLVPLPQGEPALATLLRENIALATGATQRPVSHVLLVDHGSPIPQVTAVRTYLASQLRGRLEGRIELREAVMERRDGPEFDFNGQRLDAALNDIARTASGDAHVVLSLLFISPGRHAGPGGDIAEICTRIAREHPRLTISTSPLVGDHPALIDILQARLNAALATG